MTQSPLSRLVDIVLDESGYRDNSFLKNLRDGEFCKDDFVETQIQFFLAVVFFSRPMAALAAKIPSPELRMEILRNVWEEHGEGVLTKVHGTTFVEFLSRLAGLTPAEIEKRALWPEVRAFNTTLTGACVLDEYQTGVGMMGIIERMFADISARIGKYIVARGWLSADQMIHYSLHEDLDIRHSQDFFDVLEVTWGRSPEDRYAIEQGLRLGAYIFNTLFEALYSARTRRSFRETKGPHSRAEG